MSIRKFAVNFNNFQIEFYYMLSSFIINWRSLLLKSLLQKIAAKVPSFFLKKIENKYLQFFKCATTFSKNGSIKNRLKVTMEIVK